MLFKFLKNNGGMRFSRSYGPRNDKKGIPDQVGDDDTVGKGPERRERERKWPFSLPVRGGVKEDFRGGEVELGGLIISEIRKVIPLNLMVLLCVKCCE